jgi:hypothetical protein
MSGSRMLVRSRSGLDLCLVRTQVHPIVRIPGLESRRASIFKIEVAKSFLIKQGS